MFSPFKGPLAAKSQSKTMNDEAKLKTYVLVSTPSGRTYRDSDRNKSKGFVAETPSTLHSPDDSHDSLGFMKPSYNDTPATMCTTTPSNDTVSLKETPSTQTPSTMGYTTSPDDRVSLKDSCSLSSPGDEIGVETELKVKKRILLSSPPRTTSTARMMLLASKMMKKATSPSKRINKTPDKDDLENEPGLENGRLGVSPRQEMTEERHIMSTARMLSVAKTMRMMKKTSKTPPPPQSPPADEPEPELSFDVTVLPPPPPPPETSEAEAERSNTKISHDNKENEERTSRNSLHNGVVVPYPEDLKTPPKSLLRNSDLSNVSNADSSFEHREENGVVSYYDYATDEQKTAPASPNEREPDALDTVFKALEYAFCSEEAQQLPVEDAEPGRIMSNHQRTHEDAEPSRVTSNHQRTREDAEPGHVTSKRMMEKPRNVETLKGSGASSKAAVKIENKPYVIDRACGTAGNAVCTSGTFDNAEPGHITPRKMIPPRKSLADDASAISDASSDLPFDCRDNSKKEPEPLMESMEPSPVSIEVVQDEEKEGDLKPKKKNTPLKLAYSAVKSTFSRDKYRKGASANEILNDLATTSVNSQQDPSIMLSKTKSTSEASFDVEAGRREQDAAGRHDHKNSTKQPAASSPESDSYVDEGIGRQLFPEENNPEGFILRVPENKKNQPERERRKMSWWKILFYLVVALCLVAIIVFASMLLTSKNSRSPSLAEEADNASGNATSASGDAENINPDPESGSGSESAPSPSPYKPPESEFGNWVGPGDGGGNDTDGVDDAPDIILVDDNGVCSSAVPLEGINLLYRGTTANSTWDHTLDVCGDNMAIGYGTWYTFTPARDILIEVSTCGATEFDTQITVLSGGCDGFTCEAYNDQSCGDQSRATWFAEQDKLYYILVHGYRDARGEYDLLLSPVAEHDQCDLATGPLLIGSTVFGTTAGSTEVETPQCGGIDTTKPGVWYLLDESSIGWVRAAVLGRNPRFSPQIAIYAGNDCDNLRCVGGSRDGAVSWRADSGIRYYMFVSSTTDETGGFDLYLGSEQWQDTCDNAVEVIVSDFPVSASSAQARPHNVQSCGGAGKHTAPGLWFKVTGNGMVLKADTCLDGSTLDTEISVFQGSCGGLQCVEGSGQNLACSEEGAVSWLSSVGTEYLVFVSGHASRTGDFNLRINEVETGPGSLCHSPLDVASSSFISGSTEGGLEMPVCGGVGSSKGVWYKFEGTGNMVNVSLCNSATNFDARLSLFSGSCVSLDCMDYTSGPCGENSYIEWLSIVDASYFLFVHGADSTSTGDFQLQLTDSELNDSCETAIELGAITHSYSGSSVYARSLESAACARGTHDRRGMWYTIIGTGKLVTISTCSENTDFDTEITILQGSCDDLYCFDSSRDRCGDQAAITFRAREGEAYLVHIHGEAEDDVGNFIMGVSFDDSPFI